MFCVNCGSKLERTWGHCSNCGKRIGETEPQKLSTPPGIYSKPVARERKSRKAGCGTIILGLLLIGAIGSAISGGDSRNASDSSSSPTQATASPRPTLKPTTEISTAHCTTIEINITMIRNVFEDGTDSPSKTIALLDAASSEWRSIAASYSGSKSDWLKKMAELSTNLGSFIATGEPSNGEIMLDQLYNNFALADNFCG